jgi:hypothetical protein
MVYKSYFVIYYSKSKQLSMKSEECYHWLLVSVHSSANSFPANEKPRKEELSGEGGAEGIKGLRAEKRIAEAILSFQGHRSTDLVTITVF